MKTVRQMLDGKGPLVSISSAATVFDALALMARHDIGALIVIDDGRLSGIFSERDYARKVILEGKASRDTLVQEIMSAPAVYTAPESTVDECMRQMTENRVRHLPVLDRGRVIGIVSIGDLVNWIISSHEETISQLHAYVSSSYPG